jgi:hypothetical protein
MACARDFSSALTPGRRIERRHAGAHQGRRIGHYAHEPAVAAQPASEVREADSGRDRDDELGCEPRAQFPGRFAHLLRLDGEHDAVRGCCCRIQRRPGFHGELTLQPLARRRSDLDHAKVGGVPALREQATDHGARHVAAADESDVHVEGVTRYSFFVSRSTNAPMLPVGPRNGGGASGVARSQTSNESPLRP